MFASTDIRHNPLYKDIDLNLLNQSEFRNQIHSKALYGKGKLKKKLLRQLRYETLHRAITENVAIYQPYALESEEATRKLFQRLEQKNKILKIMNTSDTTHAERRKLSGFYLVKITKHPKKFDQISLTLKLDDSSPDGKMKNLGGESPFQKLQPVIIEPEWLTSAKTQELLDQRKQVFDQKNHENYQLCDLQIKKLSREIAKENKPMLKNLIFPSKNQKYTKKHQPITGTILNFHDNQITIGTRPNYQFVQFLDDKSKKFSISEAALNVDLMRQTKCMTDLFDTMRGKIQFPCRTLILDLIADISRRNTNMIDKHYPESTQEIDNRELSKVDFYYEKMNLNDYKDANLKAKYNYNLFREFAREKKEDDIVFQFLANGSMETGCVEEAENENFNHFADEDCNRTGISDQASVTDLTSSIDASKKRSGNRGLNSSQKQAFIHSIYEKFPISVIHGPPGTGKTKTLASIILYLIITGKRILVTAQSNAAIDKLLSGVHERYIELKEVLFPESKGEVTDFQNENDHERMNSENNYSGVTKSVNSTQRQKFMKNKYEKYLSNIDKIQNQNYNDQKSEIDAQTIISDDSSAARTITIHTGPLDQTISDLTSSLDQTSLTNESDLRFANLRKKHELVSKIKEYIVSKEFLPMTRIGNTLRISDTEIVNEYTYLNQLKRQDREIFSEYIGLIEKTADVIDEEALLTSEQHKKEASKKINNSRKITEKHQNQKYCTQIFEKQSIYHNKKFEIEEEIIAPLIKNSRAVFSTVSSSCANGGLMKNFIKQPNEDFFDFCIIDEASQCLETAAYLPMIQARKTILAGDHKQLPPTIPINIKKDINDHNIISESSEFSEDCISDEEEHDGDQVTYKKMKQKILEADDADLRKNIDYSSDSDIYDQYDYMEYDSSDSEVEGCRPLPYSKFSNQRRKDHKNRRESKKKRKMNENAQRSSHVERLISKTLMERIDETYGSRFVVRLNTQYRMNRKIAEWSNKTFYGNKLKTFPKVANMTLNDLRNENGDLVFPKIAKLRHFLMGPRRPSGLPPILFVDTPYSGEVDYDRMDSYYTEVSETIDGRDYICHKSSCNIGEASLAVTYVKKLLVQDYFLEPNDIGIIAPYGAQVNLIKHLLNNQPEGKEINHLDEITVSSVDGFQGQERKVIIVSMVRNNINNSLGFLTDLRRMNVAVTRAKFHLVLIGNERCLTNSKIQEFTSFIDHFRNANSTNHFNNIFYTDLLTRMGNGTRMVYQTQIRLCVNFMQDKLKFQQVDDRLYFSEKTGKIEPNINDDYAPYKGALKDKQVREEIEEEVRQSSSPAYNQFVNTQIRKNDYFDVDTLYELIEVKKKEKEDKLWRLRQRGLYDILENRTNEDFEIQNIERKIKNQEKSQENYDRNWSQLNKKYGIYDSDDEEQMKKLKKDSKISKTQKWSDFDYHQDYVDKTYNQVIYKPVPFSREEKIRMLANHRDKEEKEDLNYKLKYGPIAEQIKKHDNMENEKGQVSAIEKERSIEKNKISIRERFLQDVQNQNQKESQKQAMESVKIELAYKPTRSENDYSKRSSSARFSNISGNTLNDSWSNCHVITESNSQNSLNSTRISRSSSARFPLNENELSSSSSSSSSDEIDVNLFNRTRSSKCQSRKSVSRPSSRISKTSKSSNPKNDKVLPERKIIESDIRKLSRMSATRGEACESESDSSSYVSTVISM